MNNAKGSGERPVFEVLRAVILGTVIGAVICTVLLGAFSLAFVSAGNIPQSFLPPFIIVISVLSAFFAGLTTAKLAKRRGLIYGTSAGILLFLLFWVAGLVSAQALPNAATGAESGARLLMMALAGALGGLLAVNKKPKRK